MKTQVEDKKGQRTNLENTTQKTKNQAIRTSLKAEGELRCSGRVSNSCFTSGTTVNVMFDMMCNTESYLYMK
jgi:hypothetical protein